MNPAYHPAPPPGRRSFLKWAINLLGGLFALVLGVPAVAYLIDARNRPARSGDFKTVARFSELPVGVPRQAVIRDVRADAWTLHPNDLIGRVWLIRRNDQDVDAYTASCPHLGCSINFKDAAKPEDRRFICPCHNGTFDLSGQLTKPEQGENPPPRGMDKLECRRDPENPDWVQVKYQNFKQGLPTSEVKS
jgi:Rieske Fe-S protein